MKDEYIIAYLKNELEPGEKSELEAWLTTSDENQAYFNKLKFLWEQAVSDYQNTPIRSDRVWNRIESAVSQDGTGTSKSVTRVLRTFSRIAAIGIILIAIGLLTVRTVRHYQSPQSELIITQAGTEIRELVLPDNSRVWLNNDSEISYPEKFRGRTREVKIEGEAFFEVTRKRRMPFMVHTGNSAVQVMGTSFNVKRSRDKDVIIVSVVTGRVAFFKLNDPDSRVYLDPGQQGIYHSEHEAIIKKTNTGSNFLSWKTGILVFKNTPLHEVCQDLSRHFRLTITPTSALINKGKNLTTSFDNKDIEEILNILSITLDISYKTEDGILTLFSE